MKQLPCSGQPYETPGEAVAGENKVEREHDWEAVRRIGLASGACEVVSEAPAQELEAEKWRRRDVMRG